MTGPTNRAARFPGDRPALARYACAALLLLPAAAQAQVETASVTKTATSGAAPELRAEPAALPLPPARRTTQPAGLPPALAGAPEAPADAQASAAGEAAPLRPAPADAQASTAGEPSPLRPWLGPEAPVGLVTSPEAARGFAVEPGLAKLSPEATAYLVDTLLARRDKVGRAYIEAVTPLDFFSAEGARLCAEDQAIRFGLANSGVAELLDAYGEVLHDVPIAEDAQVCWAIPTDDAYRVLTARTRRGRTLHPPMEPHIQGGRLLGLHRVARR